MDITAEAGTSWANQEGKDVVYALNGIISSREEEIIREFLEAQPESFIQIWTVDELMEVIRMGNLIPWFYIKDGEPIGMALTSIHRYSPTMSSFRVDFVTCKHLLKTTAMIYCIEEKARALGFAMIEAIAHPTLAELAVRKFGYHAPAVYVRKFIQHGRRN